MNVDMSERQCPSFVSYHSLNYLLGNIVLDKLCLDDGGGGMSGLRFDLRESVHLSRQVASIPTLIRTYAFIPTLFSLLIEILIVFTLLELFE
jgi:hypothetical protein